MTTTTQILIRLANGESLSRDEQARMAQQLWGAWMTINGQRSFQLTDRGRTILNMRSAS